MPPSAPFNVPAVHANLPASQPIETIRVGQRVVTPMSQSSPLGAGVETQVDPSTWRLLRLRAEDHWPDGTLDVINVETLQPPEWIAQHGAKVGATVSLPLDLVEMGLPEGMEADVTADEPCPPLGLGPGRVVLTTVNHLNANVVELTLVDNQGREERLRPTGTHKFYSLDRGEFVPAEELRQGEQLQGIAGRLTLLRRERVPGAQRVYNMTVEGEHVYRVALAGVLVHNTCPTSGGGTSQPHQTPDQQALTDLAKEAQKVSRTNPIDQADAQTLIDWADEVGLPSHGPEVHPNRPMNSPHIHIGGVGHIRVQ